MKAILLLAIVTAVTCHDTKKQKPEDPFSALDRHLTHTLAYHYLWPWSQLMRAAAALDLEDSLEEPKIVSDNKKFEVLLSVRSFKPDELRVKVKNRYILIEGKHKNTDEMQFMANHFLQKFALPAGSKQEEVTAVLNEKGVLVVSVPKHELPPPPPERDVPIEVRLPVTEKPDNKTEVTQTQNPEEVKVEKIETSTEIKEIPVQTSSANPLNQLDLVETTTHVQKIKKKELKTTPKTAKDNEVTKGDTNGLDYALIETELE